MRLTTTITAATAIIASAAVALGVANASTIQFNNVGVSAPTLSGTVDGVGITVTAATSNLTTLNPATATGTGTVDPFGPFNTGELNITASGLGVTSTGLDGSDQFDGLGFRDLAILSFDQTVTLRSIDFSFVDGNDDFVLFAGDSVGDLTAFSLQDVMASVSGLDVVASVFAIGAFDFNDNFRISTIEFDAAAVPLPAAAPLFIGALMAGGIARRRARRAA